MIVVRRVVGDSMLPNIKAGQIVIGARNLKRLKVGDVVIARAADREIIKRVVKMNKSRVFLEGDNKKSSTDSRRFGWLDLRSVAAKVLLIL